MLTHHRRPVCLSLISLDLPIWFTVETAATLYQKDRDRFHLLLNQAPFPVSTLEIPSESPQSEPSALETNKGLLWLELSPYRAIMTMQGNGKLGYRHFWEQGVYGITRYWLYEDMNNARGAFRLRNFTRSLILEGSPLPHSLRIEYELWADQLQLGCYVLSLEIHH
ncbi:hypothetical protein [Oscillatoria sp. FACHB-1406]|uniref:hypothetical protein n=1 Tax=Oscillatoria sp. FACHB-1406 TaxID=2692846 RepID=UPI0016861641|nr:hypothetical protein [Oscillatoria sp. FACHB-1406]MBD2580212.1 hypothetical protein [Oscillatoria sp. FACHB-1406]